MKISFDFDPQTNKVSNFQCVGNAVTAVKATRKKKSTQSSKVVLNGNSLKLGQEVLDLLGVTVGDRLCIEFTKERQPVLVTAEGKSGNLVTKSLTTSCKGKSGELLAEYGTEFSYKLESKGYLLLTNELVDVKIAEARSPKMHQDLLDTEDFTTTIQDGEEVDLIIEI